MYGVYCCVGVVVLLCGSVCLATNVTWNHSFRSLVLPGIFEESVLPPSHWFLQKLDHFNPTNPGTWWQKYQTNETWFKNSPDSPVFLSIGGEEAIHGSWMVAGAWLDYAQKYNALCFQLEHRFYGESRPTSLPTVESLRYLSSEQALADIAYFIEGMNERYKLSPKNKWVVFGGSYPGSLAAWARLKYPHLIHAAVSTSGPLLAEGDFKGYDEVVRESLSASSKTCANNVHQAALKLEQLLHKGDKADVKMINDKFKVCGSLDVRNPKEVIFFVYQLVQNIQGVIQNNKPRRISSGTVSAPTVDGLCKIMDNESIGSLLDRYAAVHSFLHGGAKRCLIYTMYYETIIYSMRSIAWLNDNRSWFYQTCTEFGFYQTSSTQNSLFGSLLKLQFFIDICKDAFGEDFERNRLNEGTKRTNFLYGQRNIQVSRVVFVHGSLDPWHVLGKYESNDPEAPAILINGTAHCANIYPASPDDPPQLVDARKRIEELIGQWLSGA